MWSPEVWNIVDTYTYSRTGMRRNERVISAVDNHRMESIFTIIMIYHGDSLRLHRN